jgi:ABC-type transport system substrate-binding protein
MGSFRVPASVLGLLLLFSCFGANCEALEEAETGGIRGEQPRSGGIYHIPLLNEPPTLDPAFVGDAYGVPVVQQIFDGLVQFSPELFIIPALAQNWQMEENGRLYRFALRPKARFHNGRPVTSRDVIFSLSRLLRVNPPPSILPHLLKITGAQDYREAKSERVVGLQAEGDHSVTVRLDEPYTPFLTALGMYQAKIIPAEEVISNENMLSKNPIGSGPFQLASWDANHSIRLKKFADYYDGAPYLEEIRFLLYPGSKIEQVLADFENGKLEEMPAYWQFRQRLLESKKARWIHRPSLSLLFYGINSQHPALKNVELRKALAMAIDREKIIAEVYKGQFERANTLLPPGMPGYLPQSRMWYYDLESAKTLAKQALGAAGDAAQTVEVVSNSQSLLAQAELNVVGKAWSRLGITMVPKFIPDWSQFERYLKSDALQVYRYAWSADMPDPESFLEPLFAASSQVNYMRYQDEEIDTILKTTSRIVNPIERAKLYQRLQEVAATSCPLIPLFFLSVDRVYQPSVRGIEVSSMGVEFVAYRHVWLNVSSKQ